MHEMIDKVLESVSQWQKLAKNNGVPKVLRLEIGGNLVLGEFGG